LNVQFVEYKNSRNTASYGGDLGAETLVYISPKDSPDGKAYIVVANEISGTLAVFEVINNNTCVDTESNITQQSCISYTAPDGEVYTSSGTKYAIVQNANGCDSIINIQLTITSIDTSVTISSNAITSNQIGATYRWLDCNNGFAIIAGETGQTFIPKTGGSFAVEITRATCADTSACVLMTTGLNDFDDDHPLVKVFPNPAKDFISIQSKSKMSSLVLYDLNGKILLEQKINGFHSIVNTKEFGEGVYMIQVLNDSSQILNRSLQVIIR